MGALLRLLRLNEPRAHMTMTGAIFLAVGVTLWLQPGRFGNTPSYADLLRVMPQQAWGSIYLAAGVLKAVAIWRYRNRTLLVVCHTVAITLISAWLLAFVVRYCTDSGTTIVNVASWSTYLYLAVRSALMIDEPMPPPPVRRGGG